ncbi:MAG: MBL fold metallo-hydrolase [Candidatus Bathyarchaeota archaeon]|nr:MBL fold metallo-hydrolase [Candidatus Bathyarchaeota archaeon]
MSTQRRRTAGIRLVHGSTQVHLDPGPGALVFSNWAGLSPQKLDAVAVTHCHPDHYSDAEVFIEAMTHGATRKKGLLAATRSVLYGVDNVGPSISKYHRGMVSDIVELEPNIGFNVDDLGFTAVEARHSDPTSVGLRLSVPELGEMGYTSDTGYFPELCNSYRNLKLLVLCVMWPRDNHLNIHLNTDDALKLLEESQPKCAVLTHFGMRMLNADPEKEAIYLSEETGVPVIAARDGLKVMMGDQISFIGPRKSDETFIVDA